MNVPRIADLALLARRRRDKVAAGLGGEDDAHDDAQEPEEMLAHEAEKGDAQIVSLDTVDDQGSTTTTNNVSSKANANDDANNNEADEEASDDADESNHTQAEGNAIEDKMEEEEDNNRDVDNNNDEHDIVDAVALGSEEGSPDTVETDLEPVEPLLQMKVSSTHAEQIESVVPAEVQAYAAVETEAAVKAVVNDTVKEGENNATAAVENKGEAENEVEKEVRPSPVRNIVSRFEKKEAQPLDALKFRTVREFFTDGEERSIHVSAEKEKYDARSGPQASMLPSPEQVPSGMVKSRTISNAVPFRSPHRDDDNNKEDGGNAIMVSVDDKKATPPVKTNADVSIATKSGGIRNIVSRFEKKEEQTLDTLKFRTVRNFFAEEERSINVSAERQKYNTLTEKQQKEAVMRSSPPSRSPRSRTNSAADGNESTALTEVNAADVRVRLSSDHKGEGDDTRNLPVIDRAPISDRIDGIDGISPESSERDEEKSGTAKVSAAVKNIVSRFETKEEHSLDTLKFRTVRDFFVGEERSIHVSAEKQKYDSLMEQQRLQALERQLANTPGSIGSSAVVDPEALSGEHAIGDCIEEDDIELSASNFRVRLNFDEGEDDAATSTHERLDADRSEVAMIESVDGKSQEVEEYSSGVVGSKCIGTHVSEDGEGQAAGECTPESVADTVIDERESDRVRGKNDDSHTPEGEVSAVNHGVSENVGNNADAEHESERISGDVEDKAINDHSPESMKSKTVADVKDETAENYVPADHVPDSANGDDIEECEPEGVNDAVVDERTCEEDTTVDEPSSKMADPLTGNGSAVEEVEAEGVDAYTSTVVDQENTGDHISGAINDQQPLQGKIDDDHVHKGVVKVDSVVGESIATDESCVNRNGDAEVLEPPETVESRAVVVASPILPSTPDNAELAHVADAVLDAKQPVQAVKSNLDMAQEVCARLDFGGTESGDDSIDQAHRGTVVDAPKMDSPVGNTTDDARAVVEKQENSESDDFTIVPTNALLPPPAPAARQTELENPSGVVVLSSMQGSDEKQSSGARIRLNVEDSDCDEEKEAVAEDQAVPATVALEHGQGLSAKDQQKSDQTDMIARPSPLETTNASLLSSPRSDALAGRIPVNMILSPEQSISISKRPMLTTERSFVMEDDHTIEMEDLVLIGERLSTDGEDEMNTSTDKILLELETELGITPEDEKDLTEALGSLPSPSGRTRQKQGNFIKRPEVKSKVFEATAASLASRASKVNRQPSQKDDPKLSPHSSTTSNKGRYTDIKSKVRENLSTNSPSVCKPTKESDPQLVRPSAAQSVPKRLTTSTSNQYANVKSKVKEIIAAPNSVVRQRRSGSSDMASRSVKKDSAAVTRESKDASVSRGPTHSNSSGSKFKGSAPRSVAHPKRVTQIVSGPASVDRYTYKSTISSRSAARSLADVIDIAHSNWDRVNAASSSSAENSDNSSPGTTIPSRKARFMDVEPRYLNYDKTSQYQRNKEVQLQRRKRLEEINALRSGARKQELKAPKGIDGIDDVWRRDSGAHMLSNLLRDKRKKDVTPARPRSATGSSSQLDSPATLSPET